MHTTPQDTPTRARSRRRPAALGLALLAAAALLVASCDAPDKPSGTLFDHWKAADKAHATETATPTAVNQLFAKPWASANGWFFSSCDGAAGSNYCTWIDNTEGRLVLKTTTQFQQVTSVQRIALGNINAGRFFHAWRQGKKANAAPYGTPAAANAMFSVAYDNTNHWEPAGCDSAAGTTYCNWYDDESNAIVLKVSNATGKVTGVDRGVVD